MSDVASQLIAAGMSATEAERKGTLFATLEDAHRVTTNARQWFVPGRIEVLGKHTDYAGGRSLLCATERGMCVSAQPRQDDLVQIIDVTRRETLEVRLSPDLVPIPGWGTYVGTVVRRVARNFPAATCGADIAIASDLPAAAGLSSSSVLVVAVFTALSEINRLRESEAFRDVISSPELLAEYLGCVENGQSYRGFAGDRGVGTFGGSEDHTAILCSQAGSLACYSYCPVMLVKRVRMPEEWVFAIASSGVHAHKTGSTRDLYNRASREASAVLEVWRTSSGSDAASLSAAIRRSSDAPDSIRKALRSNATGGSSSEDLLRRFEQFLLESEEIVPAAVSAFETEDMDALGDIVERSQSAAERLLCNQVPETIALAKSARRLGACAASAFGAGFGGSVWALIRRSEAERFIHAWRATYFARFPTPASHSEFFITGAAPGLMEVGKGA